MVAKGERGCGWDGAAVWDLNYLNYLNKLFKIEWINNKVLLYSTGNYTKYLLITSNGKAYKNEYIYIYMYVNHFAIQQKLIYFNEKIF